jgi:F420-dependent oxidoreductase-like protein
MRMVVFIEPQNGASYADQLRIAKHAEDLGFDGFFRSDHLLAMSRYLAAGGLPGPTDAWTTLSAIGDRTSRIRLGTLVTAATFRLPGPLAIAVAQADQMSGGRVELGLGAGWYEAEHAAYGVPFPPLAERFDRLEEQLAIVTGLWRTPPGEHFNFDGRHYQVAKSPALPKPVQVPGPPVIIGGAGPRRTPALAARYADEFNVPFRTLDQTAEAYRRVTEACAAIGRDKPPVWSAAQTVACGRTGAEARARAEGMFATPPLSGTPDQVVDQIGGFVERGTRRMFLQILDLADLDHLDVIASSVLPQLATD